jgi:hypothetical protein
MRTDRVTPPHLKRTAIVYVRQSSPEQVRSHAESTRIQVGLRDKAVAFGWPKPVTPLARSLPRCCLAHGVTPRSGPMAGAVSTTGRCGAPRMPGARAGATSSAEIG